MSEMLFIQGVNVKVLLMNVCKALQNESSVILLWGINNLCNITYPLRGMIFKT